MILDKVKLALRIAGTDFDDEVKGIISACFAELRAVGVDTPKAIDGDESPSVAPLVERATILYAKANFGYYKDNEKYQRAYDHLKCFLIFISEEGEDADG